MGQREKERERSRVPTVRYLNMSKEKVCIVSSPFHMFIPKSLQPYGVFL